MAKKEGTSNAEPMTFETFVMPNLTNERGRLAREGAGMSKDEVVERATAVGIPTDGSKEKIVQRAQEAARAEHA